MYKKIQTYLLPLLFVMIMGSIIHTANGNAVLPDNLYATQNYEELINTLHDIREAVHQRIDEIWYYEQKQESTYKGKNNNY
ncbi:hypothetical protein EW338_16510 [Salmonella enterica subsp. enterica serovar Richmond]|nr:hypothetical protein [Salmonella enterica subsp. enterica serovar Richmond]ECG3313276.1 hypothetical protein [Salmonella enterica subsp. enterica serovar Richmond]